MEYTVGFGKPPTASRFKKGVSGNPKGRPRGKRNAATELARALNQKIPVVENGRRRMITKREAMITQMVNQSVRGEPRARKQVLDLIALTEQSIEITSPLNSTLDELLMENFINRFRPSDPPLTEPEGEPSPETHSPTDKDKNHGS